MTSNVRNLQLVVNIDVYRSIDELSESDKQLLIEAKKSVETAYAPYSGFHVGAAIKLSNGQVVTGSNQENAAYPSGLCAERVALFYAHAQHPGIGVDTIAISVKSKSQVVREPVSPCGACRQVIAEYENLQQKPVRIIMSGETGEVYISGSIENLLPLVFNKKHLE